MRRPRLLLALLTLAAFLAVTRGEFSDADTQQRLQVTHWLWSDQPQVAQYQSRGSIPAHPTYWNIMARPGFCVLPGKDGKLYAQFALGQSLLMAPSDILAASLIGSLHGAAGSEDADRFSQERMTVVNFVTFSILNAFAIVLSYDLLLLLGFSERQSMASAALLLFATPFIVYMQDVAETNQMYLFYVGAMVFALKARRNRLYLNCAICGTLAGFNVLMKLPNLVYAPGLVLVFLFAEEGDLSWPERLRWAISRQALKGMVCLFAPLCAFIFVDRYYQYFRFGEWFSTYMKECAEAYAAVGGYPEAYPFGYDRAAGFLGPFFSADRSLFLFSPFLVFTVMFLAFNWRSVSHSRRLAVVASLVALAGLALIYGGSYYWNGGAGSWGPRHHLPPAQALCLLGFAFAAQGFASFRPLTRSLVAMNIVIALACQTAALAYSPLLENQAYFLGDPWRVVPLIRARNIYRLLNGSLNSYGATLDDAEMRSHVEDFAEGSPDILWLSIGFGAAAEAPLLARAVITAWCLFAAAVIAAAGAICVVGFRRSDRAPSPATACRGLSEDEGSA
ncbi:hypothetical protein [Methylocystis heyeri]|uniref:Glycosyltransferase RgtA/B/C/D-like domain-containing protein n=1 Tax=Methylocystis heyeri TaxID=391905 RepID=A0A6B8KJE0_9HYPH|nr:hypothetical protein [Methylocystis heyeri]QGM46690.1 hypothetical protein H2LOC_013855 [Methylocystis heyeri]